MPGDYGSFTVHPAADLFPLLQGDEFAALVEDIKQHGQLEPVEILGGTDEILDGRNRYRACVEAGVTPRTIRKHLSDQGPYEYVISKNLRRRQLTPDRAAMVAVAALPHLEKEAEKRKLATLKQNAAPESVGQKTDSRTIAEDRNAGKSTQKAAEQFGVSRHKVEQAKKVAKADPALADQVKAGEVKLADAAKSVTAKTIKEPKSDVDPQQTIIVRAEREARRIYRKDQYYARALCQALRREIGE